MKASERRVLLTDLVEEANDLEFLNDHVRVGYFRCSRVLMNYEKSDADDIKPQFMITKNMHDSHANTNANSNIDSVSPS